MLVEASYSLILIFEVLLHSQRLFLLLAALYLAKCVHAYVTLLPNPLDSPGLNFLLIELDLELFFDFFQLQNAAILVLQDVLELAELISKTDYLLLKRLVLRK